ncbi:D-alanyl-D-alanine carboxypeptidase/D-alanyl-D-alanine-endopeptidase [Candidatus Sumerlaeota bacterium]|nr:D-alanyl-D-alanine carboxypeptidase/D-alanyl-D-alanine-endopeptidase [Candidatus Sumerlaeota bacterium]
MSEQFDRIFSDPDFVTAFFGVRVERADGSVIYDRNGEKMLMPASNMKVVTTAAALELLGADYKYETRLETCGKIADGKLEGDLVIVGSGDPSLGTWRLENRHDGDALLADWVAKVKGAGINEITGAVVADGRVFTAGYIAEDWEYGDLPFWYAAGTSGVNFSENVFRFTTAPGAKVGDKALLTFKPETRFFTVSNDVLTTTSKGARTADITRRHPGSNEVIFGGTIAVDEEPFEQRGSIWDGELYAATLLTEALNRAGVKVAGPPASARALPKPVRIDVYTGDRRVLDTVLSPPVSELIRIVNKTSHNFYADCLFRTLGVKMKHEGSYAAGGDAVHEWLKKFDSQDAASLHILDGSGLARRDYVTPRLMCAVLQHMRRNPDFETYKTTFPTPGQEYKDRKGWKAPELVGNLYAKTGYIGQVRSLSGYVTSRDGELLVLSMIANNLNVPISRADRAIDEAVLLLATTNLKQ